MCPMSNVHIVHVHLQMTICGLCATQCVVRHRFAKERVGSHSVQANRLRPTMQCFAAQYTSLCKPTILCFAAQYKSVQTNHAMLCSAIYQSVQADRQIASIEMIHWPTLAF